MRVHVVGNACIDTSFRLGRLPAAGETLNATACAEGLGGKGVNQAVAAARAGAPVTLWTALGNDRAGASIRDDIRAERCRLEAIAFDLPSDRSTIAVDAAGENFIISSVACCRAFEPLSQTDFAKQIAAGDILVMQGNLTTAATSACLAAARRKGARRILNASPLDASAMPDLGLADVLVVNRGEAEALTGTDDAVAAAASLAAGNGGTVVITLGADGCVALEPGSNRLLRLPAPRIAAIDTSGAGDVFCGCLAACLAKAMPLRSALAVALGAAAISVTRPGTLASCPSIAEFAALIEQAEIA